MKRVFWLITLQAAVAACSAYKQSDRLRERTAHQEETYDTLTHAGFRQEQRQVLMATTWRDTQVFDVRIAAQGRYQLHPDSGLRGENATIWLRGSRVLQGMQQRREENHVSDSMVSMQAVKVAATDLVDRIETSKRGWGVPSGWVVILVLVVLIGGVWRWWIRR